MREHTALCPALLIDQTGLRAWKRGRLDAYDDSGFFLKNLPKLSRGFGKSPSCEG
jgi:hypothetical protein